MRNWPLCDYGPEILTLGPVVNTQNVTVDWQVRHFIERHLPANFYRDSSTVDDNSHLPFVSYARSEFLPTEQGECLSLTFTSGSHFTENESLDQGLDFSDLPYHVNADGLVQIGSPSRPDLITLKVVRFPEQHTLSANS